MRLRSVRYLITGVLAFHLFNFSIDPADTTFRENLSINEIESFLELLVENVFAQGDVLHETDEGDDNAGQRESAQNFLFTSFIEWEFPCRPGIRSFQYPGYQHAGFNSLAIAINTPPPKSDD